MKSSRKKRDGFSKDVINFIEKMGFSAGQIKQGTGMPQNQMGMPNDGDTNEHEVKL